jgi:Mrp family chromosome partitioning ATPase
VTVGSRNGRGPASGQDSRKLVCIPAGDARGAAAELLASARLSDFIATVKKVYDLVVIDSSPMLATADPLELVSEVDSVLVCVRLGQSTREVGRAFGEAMELQPDRPIGMVLTGAKASDGYYGGYGY